jgi:aspartyl protease family protein
MATGFIGSVSVLRVAHSIFVLCSLLFAAMAQATEVSLVGLFSGKALVVIGGGRPRTVELGVATAEGVKLLAVEEGAAQFEIDGRRQRLVVGQHTVSMAGESRSATATLTADARGHFYTVGTINGVPVRLLVDTGATFISMGVADAVRANVDYLNGQPGMSATANGAARVWRVKLTSVRVGDVLLNGVDAVVHEINLPFVLLGMSFLNRMEMKRDGQTMTLKKRF